ncbi:tyrosine-type recombinase/integrase [Trichocoleus sp. FACHB-262]|uniref:tyrosine-type recombinase/integrase n=1 Tax=Trichocoleus sp. FACHB-262 TaxID=2692869 RepID=UPI001688F1C7|nr:tyrosine-type recombinase/integrase [Trichocoleus sp. FACHB-262]MBD2122410.1 tyrosine-type recombinase/integrase [Trichocoleus sp. FACHB-262]
MQVQRIKYPNGQLSWIVIGDDYLPIQPIRRYLQYCEALEFSPNTIQAYARHLKLYWEFLSNNQLNWKTIKVDELSNFITWLRHRDFNNLAVQPCRAKRTERTINTILSAVYSFYTFQGRSGEVENLQLYTNFSSFGSKRFKPFLHHITKHKPAQKKLLKLKEARKGVKTFTREQVEALITACNNRRDKLLLSLLHETGMRIGQALGLRHEDFKPWDNQIHIVPRENVNQARTKRKESYKIDVSIELMNLYSDYFMYDYPEELITDYVFVNIWEGKIGHPISYSTVADLFERLRKKTGIIEAHPHMFRHTHATELIEAGVDALIVRERLGHASIQTTINTYTHVRPKALKNAYQNYLEARDK